MSYYQRPMGDYKTYGYAGDPGFLSGLWKGIKKVAKVGLAYYTGGVAGAMASQIGGGPGTPKLPPPTGRGLQTVQGYPVGMSLTMPGGMSLAAQGMIPRRGAIGEPTRAQPGYSRGIAQDGMCPSGYHLAKDGTGRWVRNRRMNIANPRALRRAMRRVQGFEKLAKRTIVFTRRTRIKKRKSS